MVWPRWATTASLLGAGFAGGTAIALGARLLRRADCSNVASTEGVVAGVPYLERIRGGADPDAALPMVILFHGIGANPQGVAGMLGGIGPARLIIPEGEIQSGSLRKWWPMGIKSTIQDGKIDLAEPQWRRAAQRIEAFIDDIVKCRPTLGRPIVTGSSQGGEMALLVASTMPRKVDSAVAVSSYLLPPFWDDDMALTLMIHGDGDKTVPFAWAQQYAQQMVEQGATLTFAALPSPGHDVTSAMAKAWISAVADATASIRGEHG